VHNLGRLADGRLHFTMRLVRGRTFANILKDDAGKPERLPALLAIFEKVCQAVAYAHSKRVIHRDLKPANVMVGKFGEVQVMDWGLAKVLNPEAQETTLGAPPSPQATAIPTEPADTPLDLSRAGAGMGTPAYAPPEQALGEWESVDERADVFALGAILCEILTGQPTYTGPDGEKVLQRARRADLTEALGRLDRCGADAALVTLCRVCLAPNRDDRPRDAEAVAQRVADYQTQVQERLRRAELERAEAVVTVREERKRRRWALAFALLLLVGSGISTWLAVRATIAEGKATQSGNQAQSQLVELNKVIDLLASTFHDLHPRAEARGGPSLRQQMTRNLKRVAKQLDEEAIHDPLTMARLRHTLGLSLSELGDPQTAIELLSKAQTTRESELGADHRDTLKTSSSLAGAYYAAGQRDKAVSLFEKALERTRAKFGTDDSLTLDVSSNLAAAYQDAGQPDKALPLFEQVLKKRMATLGEGAPDTLLSMNNLATANQDARQLDKAIPLLERAWRIQKDKLAPDHTDTLTTASNLAAAYRDNRQLNKAVPLFEQTMEKMKKKLAPDHPDTLGVMNNLADVYQAIDRLDKAIPLLEETLAKRKIKLGPDHPNTLGTSYNLAGAYYAAGRVDKAIPLLEQALENQKVNPGPNHPDTLLSMASLATAYQDANRFDRAEPLLREWLKRNQKKDGPNTAVILGSLGLCLLKQKKHAEAEAMLRESLTLCTKLAPDDWLTFHVRSMLGDALLGQKKYAQAEPLLLEGYEGMKKRAKTIPPLRKVRLTEALERLVRFYEATGNKDKAAEWTKKLEEAKPTRKNPKS
jgi:tetratricopeptide (TPR) repeat protein